MTKALPVVETFHSIQGEGIHAGRGAFFIRLAGCNVGCHWCDTKKSWRSDLHPQRKIDDLAREAAAAEKSGAAIIVITGGEPLHHNLDDLTEAIRTRCELPIHIETSGVDAISGKPNWITLSPKRHKPPRVDLLSACNELKVVVFDEKDLEFAKECAKQASQAVWLLQPGWGNEQGQEIAILHAQSQPKWRLSLQSHKWLKVR